MSIIPYLGAGIGAMYAGSRAMNYYRGRRAANRTVATRSGRRMKPGRSYRGVDRKFMKNLMKVTESKFIDKSFSDLPETGSSEIELLNGVTVGDTEVFRDGEVIMMTSIQLNQRWLTDADMLVGQICRVMLVLKKDVRGATINISNLLVADNVLEFRQFKNSQNLKILWQKSFTLQPTEFAGDRRIKMIRHYHKFKKPIRVRYSAVGSTVAELDRNGLFLVVMSDATATFLPTVNTLTRIIFKDV